MLQPESVIADITNKAVTGIGIGGVDEMNIGQMMRSFLGETTGSDSRQVELKAGQVVRGVVLQVMDNSEALVQIGGVQVRAKLEAPMQAGQSAMLQVQPQTSGAVITLKQVDPGAVGLPEDTFKEWAKQLALPEQKWAVEIVKDLRKDGLILNRDIAQAFQQAAAAMPSGADAEQWMQAAAAAFRRGLPMTAATIGSMQQVMSGQPTHVLLTQLQQQLAALTAAGGALGLTEGQDEALNQAVARVQNLLSDGEALLRSAFATQSAADEGVPAAGAKPGAEQSAAAAGMKAGAEHAAQAAAAKAGADQGLPAAGAKAGAEQAASAAGTKVGGGQEAMGPKAGGAESGAIAAGLKSSEAAAQAARASAGALQNAPTAGAGAQGAGELDAEGSMAASAAGDSARQADASAARPNWLGQMMKWLGVDHELQLTKLLQEGVPQQQSAAAQGAGEADGAEQQTAAQQRQAAAGAAAARDGAAAMAATPGAAAEAGRAAAAGSQQAQAAEQAAARPTEHRGAAERQSALTALQLAAAVDGQTPAANEPQTRQESLKSALFSLVAAEGTPPAIKETAQQLIQQISGQQLLLTPERNSAMLTHVTMFIPLRNQDGNQTASVHIQTRRGRKGELDAANCRLLFQLSMQTLGETMVDVNVMDKVVSLNLWNDHPATASLAESARAEVAERLQQAGYQLLSLRTTPLPKPEQEAEDKAEGKRVQAPPDLAGFSSTRYKGVDFRI
jgi:hypothetical protein